jgi:hypothetical protein
MKELCIPVPNLAENEIAEVVLKVGNQNINYQFRVESFLWDSEDELNHAGSHVHNSLARITRLRSAIETYDKNWELIQIFTPSENAKYIQVLYRKRK